MACIEVFLQEFAAKEKPEIVNVRGGAARNFAHHSRRQRRRNTFELFLEYTASWNFARKKACLCKFAFSQLAGGSERC